mmetsp:Transcript_11762/g.43832  ORF Transcript_11762/g.43832 Transcript_11762/m.43832 type:complete len:267 (-) Transcript_11762:149-949(-)
MGSMRSFICLLCLPASSSLSVRRSQSQKLLEALYPPWKAPCATGVTPFAVREGTGRRFQGVSRGENSIAALLDGDKTYGEFPFPSFCKGIDLALDDRPELDRTFLDIGSGCGRLVLGAALGYSFSRCIGVELSSELHDIAEKTFALAGSPTFFDEIDADEPVDPAQANEAVGRCLLLNEDISSETGTETLQDADIVFCYSTTWEAAGDTLLGLTEAVAANCKSGARVVTTDKKLGDADGRVEVVSSLEVPNREAGGSSILYVHEVR